MTAYDTIQILTTTSEDWGYAVLHRGIRFHDKKDYVLHMTFSGAECIPAETFFKKRKLLHSKQYNLKHPINIDAIIEEDKNKPFNILTSNCETYVNEFVNKYTTSRRFPLSQQITFWMTVIILITWNLTNKHQYGKKQ